MKRMLAVIILAPMVAFAGVGKVTTTIPLPMAQPFGLAVQGDHLLISDRDTGKLFEYSLTEKKIAPAFLLPCDHPLGIAADETGLWVCERANKRIMHVLLDKKKVDRVLADVETDPTGLAWDGKNVWATSGNAFLTLDPSDGTEVATFEGPGPDTTGIFFDGKYFWLTERQRNHIVCATPDGEIIGVLPSPGPYPAGIVRRGDTLWVVDFEDKALYGVDIAFDSRPFYTGIPHARRVHFTHSLYNRGPSGDVDGKLYVCAGENDLHQRILKGPDFDPASVSLVQDNWGQKFAFLAGKVPALRELALAYTVDVETSDLNYFILPEWVQGLEKVPQEILGRYLADGSKLKIHDPYIRELSKKIVGDEKNPFWIAFRIHQYLHKSIEYQRTGGWNAAPIVLKRGNGSCSEFTFAFLALARAAGLPARYEAGIVVRGDDASIDDVYHRWVQVYLPPFGWVPVDPSRGKPATAMDVASSFGSLSNRFFITTHSGGDSPYLGWTYNYNSFYEFSGRTVVESRSEAKWDPLKK
jgi:transglutaminase-like putative cysteine protease/sugar lactone lactonase YvrE